MIFGTKSLVRAIMIVSMPVTTPTACAQAAASDDPAAAGQTKVITVAAKRGDRLLSENFPPPPPGIKPPHHGPAELPPLPPPPKTGIQRPGPVMLAGELSALETEIGIRSGQLDAWRDFTDAILGMAEQPPPPIDGPEAAPQLGANPARPPKAEPFDLAVQLANVTIARARHADALLKAVDALRSKLSAEQLEKVARLEQRLAPPPHFAAPLFNPRKIPGPDQPGAFPPPPR